MLTNILVIDDNETDRMLVKRSISKPGSNIIVHEASSGKIGLDLMRNRGFDCVFLDYTLPDMDGIHILKEIYNIETNLMPFPVVMLTGQSSESVMIDAIRYGANDYLVKDNITTDTLYIAMAKATQSHELKKGRNEAERQLVQAQKMEAIGQLTGGVAHDFNNLLTIIFGNTRLLIKELEDHDLNFDDYIAKVQTIEDAAKRGAALIKRMMAFSRHRSLKPQNVNINAIILDMQDMLQRSIGEMVQIKTLLCDEIWSVCVDPIMLEHLLINMAVNARDAMFDGGVLTIETACVDISGKEDIPDVGISPGSYVTLIVSDTGNGIPDQVRDKIFEPFFTTKDVGRGTGLGLSMVYAFVKESNGAIYVSSEEGKGTTFRIYLPRATQDIAHKNNIFAPLREARGGTETILLVEDEEEIRNLTSLILEDAGYDVIVAENGEKALEILIEKNGLGVDLLFTDIAMPGDINGVQLAARAQVLNPDIKLLFTTGYAKGFIPDMELAQNYDVIEKPYQPRHLVQNIREVLDSLKTSHFVA